MRYFDTSFLLPVFVGESFTGRVERILNQQPIGEVAVSQWTRVEFASAIARQVRMRQLNHEMAAAIDSAFESYLENSFHVLSPTMSDFDVAKQFICRHETGLRSGDALHLAVASNRSAERIYTLDRGLMRAGRLLGLPMDSGGRLA